MPPSTTRALKRYQRKPTDRRAIVDLIDGTTAAARWLLRETRARELWYVALIDGARYECAEIVWHDEETLAGAVTKSRAMALLRNSAVLDFGGPWEELLIFAEGSFYPVSPAMATVEERETIRRPFARAAPGRPTFDMKGANLAQRASFAAEAAKLMAAWGSVGMSSKPAGTWWAEAAILASEEGIPLARRHGVDKVLEAIGRLAPDDELYATTPKTWRGLRFRDKVGDPFALNELGWEQVGRFLDG
jgi:hypothetical protein